MIIDTDKLRESIDSADDRIDWENCPIETLNRMEALAIKRISIVDAIEALAKEFSKKGVPNEA